MTSRSCAAWPLAALALAACNPNATVVPPRSFDRPGDAVFVCYDLPSSGQDGTILPLGDCETLVASDEDGYKDQTRRIVALVTQTARGEVGAVDLRDDAAIDSNPVVPGATFVRVDEAPIAIALGPSHPELTFVANFGSRSVQSFPTHVFIPSATVVPGLVSGRTTFADGPTDLAYVEVSGVRFLFVPLPNLGAIAQVPVGADGALGTATLIPLEATVPAAVAPGSVDTYAKVCPADAALTPATTPRMPVSFGATPRPVRLTVVEDGANRVLLVADEALPIVHRFPLTEAGVDPEATPFVTGVPTRELAVTPLVPATIDSTSATERYVYAIDATDGSVLVLDYATGAVLPVTVGELAHDRVGITSTALTLGILEPGYELGGLGGTTVTSTYCSGDSPASEQDDATPARLRGVFLAVGNSDGTITVVDVFDLDAACRGGVACSSPANESDVYVSIRRHRARQGSFFDEAPQVTTAPSFTYPGSTGGLQTSGAPSSGIGPGLLPLDECPGTPRMVRAYPVPTESAPLVCMLNDRASQRPQRWSAVFEGGLPRALGGRGRFDADGVTFRTTDGDFCTWGVLGRQDVIDSGLTAADPESGYEGDLLVLTSVLSPEKESDPACADFRTPSRAARPRIAFRIEQATSTQLVLGAPVPDLGSTIPVDDPSFARVRACFPDLVSYEVRAYQAFTVAAGASEVNHRVVEGGGGRCIVDVVGQPVVPAEPDGYRNFRALPGRPFVHPQVAFTIRPPAGDTGIPTGTAARLVFDIGNVARPLTLSLRSAGDSSGVFHLASAILFNDADEQLYVLDIEAGTLQEFDLDSSRLVAVIR